MHQPSSAILALSTAALCTAALCPTACASHTPHTPPPPPRHLHDPAPDTGVRPLRSPPRYQAGRGAYEVTSVSILTHDVAGVARTDTLITRSIVHDNARWTSRGLDVTGSVVSRVVNASPGVLAMPPIIVDPIPFSATVDTATSRVEFVSDSAAATTLSCPVPNTEALAAARDLLTALPRTLAPGATWTDTLVTTACRDDFPIRSSAVRRFMVTLDRAPSSPEGVVIVVVHTTEARLTGAGRHEGRAVDLQGTRHLEARQQYDALTGQLLGARVASDLDLTARSLDETHHEHQHAEATVRPIAD
ncbi:MAG TPA: hypothetical protein VNW46_08370 [Gemmatimonadaceae bacterium]|nr:hypothetical protein [Gemmatimonadaceae bacterium]